MKYKKHCIDMYFIKNNKDTFFIIGAEIQTKEVKSLKRFYSV